MGVDQDGLISSTFKRGSAGSASSPSLPGKRGTCREEAEGTEGKEAARDVEVFSARVVKGRSTGTRAYYSRKKSEKCGGGGGGNEVRGGTRGNNKP